MKWKWLIGLAMLLCHSYLLPAQKAYTVLESPRKIDPSRYSEIKGSPYLYADWQPAEVVGADGKMHQNIQVNFNGLTGELEMLHEGRQSEMEPTSYLKVIVKTPAGTEAFFRGTHPQFGNRLVCVLYDGVRVKLVKDFRVRRQATEVQTPANPTVFEKFVPTVNYYLIIDGLLQPLKLRKKKVLESLGHKQQLEKYSKEHNLNLNSESGVVQLLGFYENNLIGS